MKRFMSRTKWGLTENGIMQT